jgi:hypothetical protein
LRIAPPAIGPGTSSGSSIGATLDLRNLNSRRTFGGARFLTAGMFARRRERTHNFVAKKLAHFDSTVFASKAEMNCSHATQFESHAEYLSTIDE